ncbi:transposase, MuDR, MULE transposase domain protein [Tanacetum coccineum]|uniref:Transposase, MuDR, MULE transposase domain protein n=1 Tax=Tanacetum coccineum TaxID=301880 RepID=A0ABQ4XWE3_9ASTR
MDIMNRHPVKSLLQFRTVSKQWKFSIDNFKFILDENLAFRHMDSNLNIFSLTPVASSEGVWCFAFGENSMLLLWNPSIKKSVEISVPNYTFQPDSPKMIFGFGIRPVTLEPTLLKIITRCIVTVHGDSLIISGSFDFEDCRIIYAWALEVEGGFVSSCGLLFTIPHPSCHYLKLLGFSKDNQPIVEATIVQQCLSTLHFLMFLRDGSKVLKVVENSLKVLKVLENNLESMKLQENRLVDGLIRGSSFESFEMLPYYCYNLERKNQGTVTRIKTDEKGVFEMLFIAIGASIRTFMHCLRPLPIIDAAHLKGQYKGTNLVVVGMDGNNQIVPIAFGICKGETGPCWSWWMSILKECIEKMKGLFWKICKAYTPEEFSTEMSNLQAIQPDAYHKLIQVDPQRWSRAHCPLVRYNYMTSNSVESVNAYTVLYRKLPVLKLAETYRAMVQEWYFKRQELADNMTSEITEWVANKVNKKG